MSLQNWKERYNPILVLCIAVAFCVALYLMQIRVGIEKRNDTVEQTLDYQAILMMAQREGYSRPCRGMCCKSRQPVYTGAILT